MAKSYEQVLKQIESLQAEAERLRRKEVGDVIARIREAIAHYGLSAADLGFGDRRPAAGAAPAKKARAAKKAPAKKKFTVAPKYRDDAGRTWTGRGLQPVWLREAIAGGKALKDFEIK